MEKYTFEEKNLDLAIEKAAYELGLTKDNILINETTEKNGLLKKSVTIEVISYQDLIKHIKSSLTEILELMNIKANLETRIRENTIEIKIFSDNNAILIGKNGKNMKALQIILKQIIKTNTKADIHILLDVENYKEKRIKSLEIMAKKTAREVAETKVETKLDSMNSYERRIIHSALSNNKYVYTESIGEEPNRCIVIKPKEEK